MGRIGISLAFLCVIELFILSACGPMNQQKPVYNPNESSNSINGVSSKNNLYYAHVALQPSDRNTPTQPQVGDNAYVMRVVHASDLVNPSGLKVIISYWMPDMMAMGKFSAPATRNDDGSFSFKLVYAMEGRWLAQITLEDGSIKDDYFFETDL